MQRKNVTVCLLGGPADGMSMTCDSEIDPVMYSDWPPFVKGEKDCPNITIHQYRLKRDVAGTYYGFHHDLTDGKGYDIIYEGDTDD